MGNKKKKKRVEMTTIHFAKLIFRSLIFISAIFVYVHNYIYGSPTFFGDINENNIYYMFVRIVFMIEMILRFFPSKWESMGCQKQFGRNFKPAAGWQNKYNKTARSTFIVVMSWVLLNGIIGAMHIIGVLDRGIMLLIALFYSVCDVICILFFCPFQEWMMKNKCCMTCRIYNWDYIMMFTPLLFVKNIYSWSLLAVAATLFVKWEIAVKTHPERFSETTNIRLSCAECDERLCRYKRAIKRGRRCKSTGRGAQI